MDPHMIGAFIRCVRENAGLTQQELAEKLFISDKTVSKWETGNGLPDISLLEPLAKALGVSVSELAAGCGFENRNRSFHMMRTKLYVCPVCGNLIYAAGEAAVSCHGILLTPQQAREADASHAIHIENIEDEYFVTISHEMTKEHSVSFLAALTDQGIQMVKLYPESAAEARFKRNRVKRIYLCCNRHGLFYKTV